MKRSLLARTRASALFLFLLRRCCRRLFFFGLLGALAGLAAVPSRAAEVPAPGQLLLSLPENGAHQLRVLAPNLLELELDQVKPANTLVLSLWDFVQGGSLLTLSAPRFAVTVGGSPVAVEAVGFKRRVAYAPLARRDLRVASYLYLRVAGSVADGQMVEVRNPDATLWSTALAFKVDADPRRFSPAIHVNQEGYLPNLPKKAMVGYYLGSLGEMAVPAGAGFKIVDAGSAAVVFEGALKQRADRGFAYSPAPYQSVYEADFSAFQTPGTYRLAVPGLGMSLPFRIDEGMAMNFTRAYALGLYHQRCGAGGNVPPFTRFTHDACHTAPASVPSPESSFAFTWGVLAQISSDFSRNPRHTAPQLRSEATQRYPFANKGGVDVAGGHHDAGDYSKYTTNSAPLVHTLVFAVDALPGVADLDNLGLPESGDGIPDLLQEAKWEADFLAKLQDADGGFYFLVYPRDRVYENNVTPDRGDPQVVWPKNTAATAASVAALAQAASSPRFKQAWPEAAALYLEKARRGWQFLMDAIARHGKDGAYQKLTHYGDNFMHDDELAWAATELFLATGDEAYHQKLKEWFDPANPDTRRWGWWRLSESYGNAIRSYAFGARSGRVPAGKLDATFLSKCEAQIDAAGRDALRWSDQSAYGTSFPEETKRARGAGWYFSLDQAFDLMVAYQLGYPAGNDPRAAFVEAFLANMNYEAGTNPVNMAYVTGLGRRRQREIVHQYAQNDRRVMPPSGIPLGNIQAGLPYLDLYQSELGALSYPDDGAAVAPYPYYDRWSDTFNLSTEFVIVNQARALAGLAFVAANTGLRGQAWRAAPAGIGGVPANGVSLGTPVTLQFQAPAGLDAGSASIVWEARDHEPASGGSFTLTPRTHGAHWVEAEAHWPDGRRVFATTEVRGVNTLPGVTVTAKQAEASVASGTQGVWAFQRTGDLSASLTAHFKLSGTATKWNDYRRPEGDMPESVTFPAGAAEVTLTIVPVADSLAGETRSVTLTLSSDPAYNVESPSSATITVKGAGAAPPPPPTTSEPPPAPPPASEPPPAPPPASEPPPAPPPSSEPPPAPPPPPPPASEPPPASTPPPEPPPSTPPPPASEPPPATPPPPVAEPVTPPATAPSVTPGGGGGGGAVSGWFVASLLCLSWLRWRMRRR